MARSKKKLLFVLAVLMFIFFSFVVVTIIFGAQQQTVISNVTIVYNATKHVFVTIKGGVYSDNTLTQNINCKIDGDSTINGDFKINPITINTTSQDKSAYIEFIITNDQPNTKDGELYVCPKITTTQITNFTQTREVSFNDNLNYESFSEDNVRISKAQTAYIRLKFAVTDDKLDAVLLGQLALNFNSADEKPTTVHTSTIAGVGMYPQKYVGNTLNETLKSATLSATGNTYTTDINGTETTLTEYSYGDIQVAKLESSKIYSTGYKFSTGDIVSLSATYFFYVQPIKVSAMEGREVNGETKTIWLTKDIIFSQMFNTYAEGNSAWETSPLSDFLNNTFLTESGISAIKITIKNNIDSGSYIDQNDTEDTLWLPSAKEIGENGWYPTDDLCKKKPTDMVLATGLYYHIGYKTGFYWTRSASSSYNVYIVSTSGSVNASDNTSSNNRGISFAFAL